MAQDHSNTGNSNNSRTEMATYTIQKWIEMDSKKLITDSQFSVQGGKPEGKKSPAAGLVQTQPLVFHMQVIIVPND